MSTINGLSKIDLLEPHGWAPVYTDSAAVTHWRRPGKCAPGTSATTGYGEGDSSSYSQATPTRSSLSMAIRSSQPSCCLNMAATSWPRLGRSPEARTFGKQIERRGALRDRARMKPSLVELRTAGGTSSRLSRSARRCVRAWQREGVPCRLPSAGFAGTRSPKLIEWGSAAEPRRDRLHDASRHVPGE